MEDVHLPAPEEILPHRHPFLFVDEFVQLTPGELAVGRWTLTGDEWFFPGHFPGRPTLPGVIMVEALAQVGAVGVLTEPRFAGKIPLLAGVNNAKFRRQVGPGDVLDLHVELLRLGGRAGKGRGTASVEGETACQADLTFVIADQ